MTEKHYDALIIGAGFGGIYQLYSFLKLGLTAKVVDLAGDVGGTWYWNRYPGAMSDTESYVYRYSWDLEDLRESPWTHHYIRQPQVLAYLEHVVERHNLRQHMQFNTEMVAADWDVSGFWRVKMKNGDVFIVRYLVTALGLLSKQNYPDIAGIDDFKGEKYHTASWPVGVTVETKRVGVIGCGSTGVQVVTEIAKSVSELVCFQRHPQYSVPSGDGPVTPEYRQKVNERYPEILEHVRNSVVGFGFDESTRPMSSVSPEEREKVFEELWKLGNGFRFMFGGFNDITVDKEANEAACEFIRKKITQIVKDPEKARKLQPLDYYARRPLCDGGYYEQFNRDNVKLVDLLETPITKITENGILTEDGKTHELDMIIFATGFDAIDGNYNRMHIHGIGGQSLKEHWTNGPSSYLGALVPGFPNLFMITGPQGPFCNIPPAIEAHVEFITKAVAKAEELRKESTYKGVIEAKPDAEKKWNQICEKEVEGSLFKETASWIFGSNVPGKTYALRFYFGGLKKFRGEIQSAIEDGWRGFKLY
ncbi:cyclohexanone monooxygenase [Cladophialophora psammophila CBS 110553]|uniref:Cyclohexanone monooxygenase n=1 Tax=Cladophialophora psammophila CBS 110553 TaxID=1182543 RepID=W9WXG3_9EURO|nr:cyclohexanone monooxygenase [Cladophialophora psammophila CBS 110553]EXJ72877.1 cyclohexanone monooxygenase [Cladophialophora psammophila CBS 110553]